MLAKMKVGLEPCYSLEVLGVVSSIAALVIAKTSLSSTLVWKMILLGPSRHISVLNVSPGNTYIANCACTCMMRCVDPVCNASKSSPTQQHLVVGFERNQLMLMLQHISPTMCKTQQLGCYLYALDAVGLALSVLLHHMFCRNAKAAESVQDRHLKATLAAESWVNVQGIVVSIQSV